MYKVFIDNWTLILREDFNKSTILSDNCYKFRKGLRIEDLKTKVLNTNAATLTLYYEGSVDSVLKKLFQSYLWIEAAGGLVKKRDRYLVIFRHGKWDLPKGKIDKGEKKKKAAVREIEEECGISKPEILKELMATYHTFNVYGPNTIKKTYWYEMTYEGDEVLIPQGDEGITKVEWVDKSFLNKMKKETFSSISEVLENYLAQ